MLTPISSNLMSTDFRKANKISLSSSREKQIRQAINVWAAAIPHHTHTNLGDRMTINEVWDTPAYVLRLWSQIDSRWVTEEHQPFAGQSLAEREYFSPLDVNLWAFEYDIPSVFKESTEKARILRSEHLLNCHSCQATGKIRCTNSGCQSGRVACRVCHGSGRVTRERSVRCTTCNGSGKITHYHTVSEPVPGTGQYRSVRKSYQQNCSTCGGSGYRKESYSVSCDTCNGSGHVTCPTCKGTGKVTCTTCQGQKMLYHYLGINRKLYYNFEGFTYNEQMTDEELDFFVESLVDDDQKQIYTKYADPGLINSNEQAALPVLGDSIKRKLDIIHSKASPSQKILFETLHIYECPVTLISYTYQNTPYRLCVKGTDELEIVALESPISESFEALRDGAVSAARARRYGVARTRLKKALMFPQATVREADLLEGIEARMKSAVDFGIQMSAYIATIFMLLFGIYYYEHYNYVLAWADFANKGSGFWGNMPFAVVLITIFLFFIASRKLRNNIPEKFCTQPSLALRLLLGFGVGIITMALVAAAWGLVHFTGIGVLVAGVVCGAIYTLVFAFAFAYMLISWIIGLFT